MLTIWEPGRDCCDWVGPSYLSQAAHTLHWCRRVSNFQLSLRSHDTTETQGLDLPTDPSYPDTQWESKQSPMRQGSYLVIWLNLWVRDKCRRLLQSITVQCSSFLTHLRLLSTTAFNNSTKVHLDTEHRPLFDVPRCVTKIITKNGSR